MSPPPPTHLAAALPRRRYLLGRWPWRALVYLLTTVPIAGVLAAGLALAGAPLLAVVNRVRRGEAVPVALVAVLTVAVVFVLATAPLVGLAVAAVERRRLRLVDDRPLPPPDRRGWAARFSTGAAWREVGYAFLLGAVVPLAYWLVALLVLVDLLVVAGPWLADGSDPIVLLWATVETPTEAVPFAVLAALLLPVLWYGLGGLAAGQAALARRLLGRPADATALREVSRSRARLVNAYEAERRRIERDLHDAVQPRLTNLTLHLGLARLDVPAESAAARPLAVAHDQARSLMSLLRQVVHGIRPQGLTDLGLAGAVRELAEEASLPVTVRADLPHPLPHVVETTAYLVVAECLANVARHAGATRADVRLTCSGGGLVVEIADDGHGGADPARGSGLTGLADRAAAIDGRLLLASPPGGPTLVRVELPCRP
ncbi:sensor histidine kinase [Micromonospora sp. PLK6-60]|uniref:sensor histidine kinase n=1 Tax=Micromonospora sp. PLK6-60 TaxID=2873383 RepID=UPI001CA61A7B|nr:sensor histidine kinase [Micromonospora sp. PLK6-60]MBY8874131.1 sensor histidine kinase [Micromonospora sp. PLK6-60]